MVASNGNQVKMSCKKKIFTCIFALALAFFMLLVHFASNIICLLNPKGMSVFNRNNEGFLKVPDLDCSKNAPFLVILVTSRLGETEARMAIRNTWGKKRVIADKRVVTYFLLGNNSRPYDQIGITTEHVLYKDIIQKDFMDTYHNLTLKTLMGLEWIHKFCPQSTFVMKTDSDMFVNPYYLTELLLKRNSTTGLFTGLLMKHSFPVRNPNSKWYVSKEEYPGIIYPTFASGTGYVLSTDVARLVYVVSDRVPFLKVEDVFVGMCLAELKIQPEKLPSESTFFGGHVPFSPCRYKKIITSHFITPTQNLMYWDSMEKTMDGECPEVQ
ncbi:beta-1,3-galactosyltransferase 5-like [Sceloporus undulatus]|uniref:beta-1,3-galactosyltransferase 5-like n=1 Tax=Sceloporus undulatus TaxID=8520 RepID=UPI001C4A93E7|nr:beta-1,3-galactosyltransferase 5-like [Sceloporus undulatus]